MIGELEVPEEGALMEGVSMEGALMEEAWEEEAWREAEAWRAWLERKTTSPPPFACQTWVLKVLSAMKLPLFYVKKRYSLRQLLPLIPTHKPYLKVTRTSHHSADL